MYDDRITKKAPRGRHINLVCKNHPHLLWHTKNIERIGARTIFFSIDRDAGEYECDCSLRDLIVSPEYDELPDVEE